MKKLKLAVFVPSLAFLSNVAYSAVSLDVIGQYQSGIIGQSAAEIVSHDPKHQRLFVINAQAAKIEVLDIANPATPTKIFSIDVLPYGAGVNSVAIYNDVLAAAVEAPVKQDPGVVAFYKTSDFSFIRTVKVGALPDMLTFTPDGKRLLVANEGEPSADYLVDPEGSVSVINLTKGINKATVATASFTKFNAQKDALKQQGIRIFGPNASVAQDVEPEYIAVNEKSTQAFVTLQENNAVAVLDVGSAKIKKILPLGYKDHANAENPLDASDRDGPANTQTINITNWPILGMYLPDAISSYSTRLGPNAVHFKNNKTYFVTANEGDSRDYAGFSEEARIGSLTLDPLIFPNAATLKLNAALGRLNVTKSLGDTDGDGDFDKLYAFGARSFSIWDENGKLIFDSKADFEQKTSQLTPSIFNSDGAASSFDTRSDNKGPEPEGVVLGHIDNKTYAFIGLERVGGIMVYDVTNPYQVNFEGYFNASATTGDISPEGLKFIPGNQSPNGKPLLVVGNEVSGTTTLYQINNNVNP